MPEERSQNSLSAGSYPKGRFALGMTSRTGSLRRQVDMESNQAKFGSYEWIHGEIRRRASALAQTDLGGQGEDPYIVASRQIFEELLTRFSGAKRVA